jgi:serine/threonine-protein kinase
MAEQVGRVLAGRYRLVSPLGAGAAARVFLADDVTLRRRVAVKLLHEALAADEAFLRRFRAEATAAAALNHAHIMAVYDWGEDGDPFLVLEYLGGGNLRTMLDGGQLLTPSQTLQIGLEAARGLDHAHKRGIVHRDIKPANLLFDSDGRLRIGDFGVARALAEAAWTEPHGVLVGSARYASPEQARGEPIDGRADVYALGLVMIEALAGEVPFTTDTTVATLMARTHAPVPVPERAGPLRDVLEWVGQPDPADRPDAAELGQALFDVASRLPSPQPLPLVAPPTGGDDVPVMADPTHHAITTSHEPVEVGKAEPPAPAVPTGRRRRRRWPWAAALLLVLALVGAATGWALTRPPTHTVPEGVVGLSETEAMSILGSEDLGWEIEISRRFVDGTEPGTVLSLDPPSGSSLREGSTLIVMVSRGPTPVALPALEGLDVPAATAALEEVGLAVGLVNEVYHEGVAAGQVIAWWVSGEELPPEAPNGSAVDLIVSKGPEPRTVPDLAGKSKEEAEQALKDADLVPKVTEVFHSKVEKGKVIGTEPGGGAEVPRGSEVLVKVSKGPDLVKVPQVKDKTFSEAKRILEEAGLNVEEVDGDPDNRVLTTDPPADEQVERGTGVRVIMRRG